MKFSKGLIVASALSVLAGQMTFAAAAEPSKSVQLSISVQLKGLPEEGVLQKGETYKLEGNVLLNGEEAGLGTVEFSTQEELVASVDKKNVLIAADVGETELVYRVKFSDEENRQLEERYETDDIRFSQEQQEFELCVENGRESIHRLYNPNSGEHFYTAASRERDYLIEAGWRDEGDAWDMPAQSDYPIYRVYNPNAGDHHYTGDKIEVAALIKAGWKDEGIAFYNTAASKAKVYRLYNPNAIAGAHHFTLSLAEADYIERFGWIPEDNDWMPYTPK